MFNIILQTCEWEINYYNKQNKRKFKKLTIRNEIGIFGLYGLF